MTKFHKIQKYLSFFPFFSSFFVFFVTMFELNRKKAKTMHWFLFGLIFFASGITVFLLGQIPFLEQSVVLYTIVAGGVLAVANILCVELQIKCPTVQEVTQPKNSKKPWIIGLIIIGAVLFIAVVVVLFVKVGSEVASHQIPDTNGLENTKLISITEDEVIRHTDSCYVTMSSRGGSGSSSNVNDPNLEEYDCQSYSFRCKQVTGVGTMQATRTENENLTLTIETELITGNMEIFVLVDDQIYLRLDPQQQQTVDLEDIAGKLVVVKFAAESAEVSIKVTRNLG